MKGDVAAKKSLKRVDVFGFGHCCIDHLCVLDPYPEKGKKGDVVRSLVIGGGPVPTALATVVKFGGTARFCGRIGGDPEGAQVVRELINCGIDARPMVVDPAMNTARAHIWIDPRDGSRTVALDVTHTRWLEPDELDDALPAACRVLLTDGRAREATLKGLRIAREAGVTTVLDAGAARPGFSEMLPLVDYGMVSRDLADTLAPGATPEQLAERLLELGAGTAVVTAGAEGAVWRTATTAGGRIAGFHVLPYDTTGAGDVFHGSFLHGLLQGWEISPAIKFANAAAALATTKLSGKLAIPTLEEVEALMRTAE